MDPVTAADLSDDEDEQAFCGGRSGQGKIRSHKCARITAYVYLATVTLLLALTTILIIFGASTNGITDEKVPEKSPMKSLEDILPAYHECGHPLTDEIVFRRGDIKSKRKRIAGGQAVKLPSVYPWLARLFYEDKNGELIAGCTATLITRRHLLTVAHCVKCLSPAYAEINGHTELYRISNVTVSPDYLRLCNENVTNGGISRSHDIALVLLEDEVPYARPICLPLKHIYSVNTSGLIYRRAAIAGWEFSAQSGDNNSIEEGATDTGGGTDENVIYHAPIQAIHSYDCKEIYEFKEHSVPIASDMFCAGDKEGNFCSGDSGAPYFVSINNRSFVAGLASFGTENCEPEVPSVFIKVYSHLNWIKEALLNMTLNSETNTLLSVQ